jgi:hypothetical protein
MPGNMSMYCFGTNPAGKQRKRKVLEETDQKTAYQTTMAVVWVVV